MSENESTTLTEEQVHKVFTELDKNNTSKEKILKATQEAAKVGSEETEEITDDTTIPGVNENIPNVDEKKSDYIEAFKPYDIEGEEAVKFLDAILEYKKTGERKGLYNKLPAKVKDYADGLKMASRSQGIKETSDQAAEFLIKSFINDAKVNASIEDFEKDMSATIKDMNAEYAMIYNDSIKDVFSRLDEIRAENPEQAEKIEAIKKAFDDAETFSRQLELLDHTNNKKLTKSAHRLKDYIFYFNKRVNVTEVKVPDLGEIREIIQVHLPDYDNDTIDKFIVTISNSINGMDFYNNVGDVAYVYKLITNIYNYKFSPDDSSEDYKKIFSNIAKVLDKIKALA